MKEKIVFFGTEAFSALTLSKLIDDKFNIEAVITKPDFKRGRGKKLAEPTVKKIAKNHNIPVLQPKNSNELTKVLDGLEKSVGVLVSYGKIIPENIIKMFNHGIINLHPSLLPKYRGPSPIEAAILNGDLETGVSIMALDKGMDSGPVYLAETVSLTGAEDALHIYEKLGKIGAQLMSKTLPRIINGDLTPTPQVETDATYTKIIQKSDGLLDPTLATAEELECQVRAQIIYPKSFIQLDNERLIVKKAHISNFTEHPLSIMAKDGKYFVVDKLLNKNGNLVTANDYINSTRS